MPGFSDLIKFYLIEDVSSPLWLIIYENITLTYHVTSGIGSPLIFMVKKVFPPF